MGSLHVSIEARLSIDQVILYQSNQFPMQLYVNLEAVVDRIPRAAQVIVVVAW